MLKVAVFTAIILYFVSCMPKVVRINTKNGPKALGPYSTGSYYKGVLYISGQIGIDPTTGDLVSNDVESQAKRTMDNLQIFLNQLKSPMEDIIKCTVYLKNMSDFAKVNAVYGTYFKEGQYPSRVAVEVAQLPKGALVEIQSILAFDDNDKLANL